MAKDDKQPGNRDKAGRFVKGQSGNPNGRPKKPVELELREIADDPATPIKIRADIEKFFFEAVYGKAAQAIDLEAKVEQRPVIFAGDDDIAN